LSCRRKVPLSLKASSGIGAQSEGPEARVHRQDPPGKASASDGCISSDTRINECAAPKEGLALPLGHGSFLRAHLFDVAIDVFEFLSRVQRDVPKVVCGAVFED